NVRLGVAVPDVAAVECAVPRAATICECESGRACAFDPLTGKGATSTDTTRIAAANHMDPLAYDRVTTCTGLA
ncbi:MAG: hypothetical protein V3R62_04425, partial [Acidiferrobacterales bacterium]